ncbi:MAG: hypothetical protein Q4G36_11490 [Paracoccus sp. (in: a-proteobacteria)]|nr:hypothetical protein [Paracoccus sp. (in: a-proteobacteria)]
MTEPGETILAEVRPGLARAFAGVPLIVAGLGGLFLLLMVVRGDFSANAWLWLAIRMGFVAAAATGIGFAMTRNSHWQLTNRRLIDVTGNRSAALTEIGQIIPALVSNNIEIRLRDRRRFFIHYVPDHRGFARQIQSAAAALVQSSGGSR